MEYIFMRGQGIKIFSLVLNECRLNKFLIPVLKRGISVKKDILDKFEISEEEKSILQKNIKKIEKQIVEDTRFDGQSYSNSVCAIIQTAAEMIDSNIQVSIQSSLQNIYPYRNRSTISELVSIIKENIEDNTGEEYDGEQDSYEGAIVLPPKQAIYIDKPVSVLDYASLYPSSMISENLSHDCIVIDPQYDNLPDVEYLDITYDIYKPGTKTVIGTRKCRYVQGEEKGIIPKILMKLLQARKQTRKKMEHKLYNGMVGTYKDKMFQSIDTQEVFENVDASEIKPLYDEFELAMLDGLQLAYKITANSLYGQIGAKTSQIYLKDIAACTTATGRKMILHAKRFLEENFNADIVYGDTDSIFCTFPDIKENGKNAIMPSIEKATEASRQIKSELKYPHDLEYEKTFWPFILLSKKRYVGNLYEKDDKKFKQKSMGIVLKRRDNANIVKHLYGGVIDIILKEQDFVKSIDFLKDGLHKLIKGDTNLEDLVISKSLRADYKDESKIAHKVLANRIAERDPGNKPQINDRIPYVYIKSDNPKALQGDRIESPEFIKQNNLTPDFGFYITNQIMKPLLQLYALEIEKIPGFCSFPEGYLSNIKRNIDRDFREKEKDDEKIEEKFLEIKEIIVKQLLFDPILSKLDDVKISKSLLIKKYSSLK
jgi:DNA polymerase elongation subunit (family B)